MLRSSFALLLLGIASFFACAEGSEIDSIGGGGSGEGGRITGVGGSATGPTSGPATSGGPTSASASGSTGSSMSSTSSGMMICEYDAPDTCQTAESMPDVSGDTGGPTVTRKGSTSKWYKVHITEDDSNIFETDLSYRVQLTSPPGMNYDLRVHQGPQDGSPDCNVAPMNGAGNPEIVTSSWDDDQGIGGEDDSLWLNIQVLYVSGTACGPNAEWTLTVQGAI